MSEDEKWAVMVQEFKESRKSQRVWSSEKGIKRSTLRYWLERIEQCIRKIIHTYLMMQNRDIL